MNEKTEDFTINVRGIIVAWLMERDFDGLCGCECGCPIDDLIPCDGLGGGSGECFPGYKGEAPDDPDTTWMYPTKELAAGVTWPKERNNE